MSGIADALSRNRSAYRRLFAAEEEEFRFPLPDERADPFEEIGGVGASTPTDAPGWDTPAYTLNAPLPAAPAGGDSLTAESAAEALLRRLDGEARLYSQILEEE